MKTLEAALAKPYGLADRHLQNLLRRFLPGRGKTEEREIFTLPNLISLSRIPLGSGVWYLAPSSPFLAAILFGVAMITDLLDGAVARQRGPTKFGEMFDPTCDKIFFAFCALAYKFSFTYWIFSTILWVEAFILLAPLVLLKIRGIKAAKADLRSNIYGKTKFALECAALGLVVLGYDMPANICLACAIPFAVGSIIKKLQDSKMWS